VRISAISISEVAGKIEPWRRHRHQGTGDRVGVTHAALANGTFSQALEYDDTHNESIVHMSSPALAASLAVTETAGTASLRSPAADLSEPALVQRTDWQRPSIRHNAHFAE